jgi:hypothetical protein
MLTKAAAMRSIMVEHAVQREKQYAPAKFTRAKPRHWSQLLLPVPPAPVQPGSKPRRQPCDLEQQFKQQLEFEQLQLQLEQLLQLKQQFEFIEQLPQLQLELKRRQRRFGMTQSWGSRHGEGT